MQEIEELKSVPGVRGTIAIGPAGGIAYSSFEDKKTGELLRASERFLDVCKKSVSDIKLVSVRSTRREFVAAYDDGGVVLTVLDTGSA